MSIVAHLNWKHTGKRILKDTIHTGTLGSMGPTWVPFHQCKSAAMKIVATGNQPPRTKLVKWQGLESYEVAAIDRRPCKALLLNMNNWPNRYRILAFWTQTFGF